MNTGDLELLDPPSPPQLATRTRPGPLGRARSAARRVLAYRPRVRATTWPLAAAALAVAGWTAARTLGLERGVLPVQLMSFTPYVAAASVLLVLAAGFSRHWATATVSVTCSLALAGCVLPRAFGSAQPQPAGQVTLRVMTANLFVGDADPAAVVGLIRRYQVDVLAVQELTPGSQTALEAAGLATLLPHQALNPADGASGTGVFSRLPIRQSGTRRLAASSFLQTPTTLEIPGVGLLDLESAHPCAPASPDLYPIWKSDIAQQPAATPDGTRRILIGDFNTTLDHAALRRLLSTGYRDAAATVGQGLAPTWPNDGRWVPGVTIDHVLVDRRISVRTVSVHDLLRSDHRAVIAELGLTAS